MAGRSTGSFLEGEHREFVDALEVDDRGRISLPPQAREGFSWVGPGKGLWGVLEQEGRVRLLPLEAGASALALGSRLATSAKSGDDSAADRLLLLVDRYRRLSVETTQARMQLPLAVVAHLDPTPPPFTAYVARFPAHLELWGRSYRLLRLSRAPRELEDLP